ncbi:beta-ketoacyl synthase chain length factor [Microvenator marinus]|uniref:Beta-ketoacyl synthase chain length factor n=1 Tax=Microvenator marinus TaxID=2600177 RepID=A0A5B8XXD8_9DELT|nr:beta-ketoacyl synthase chain length factor [Microvenator marinus]QED28376.1 beta-ketoacyl synthase chain length factor [Microvenator marinus]
MAWIEATSSWWPGRGKLPASQLLAGSASRRAGDLTRACAHVIDELGPFSKTVPIVFGSSLGCVSVLFSLLDEIKRDELGLSPIAFSSSVHHSPVAAVGVSNQHIGLLTAVSANEDLAAMLIIEALGLSLEFDRVLVIGAEEPWPKAYGHEEFELYAGAFMMAHDSERQLIVETSTEPFKNTLSGLLRYNPAAGLEKFLEWSREAKPGDELIISPNRSGGSWKARCQ